MSTARERYIKGTEQIIKNLNKEITNINNIITKKTMDKVISFIIEKARPLTPYKTGYLRRSYSKTIEKRMNAIIGTILNTAPYALYVHEMSEYRNFTTPGTGPKFLEDVIKNNFETILNMFKEDITIK